MRTRSFQRRCGAFGEHFEQAHPLLQQVRDLALQGCKAFALDGGRLGAGPSAFDHAHAIRKAANLGQAEPGRNRALDLPYLRDCDGGKGPVTVAALDRHRFDGVGVCAGRNEEQSPSDSIATWRRSWIRALSTNPECA
jgi:hypothetical protein